MDRLDGGLHTGRCLVTPSRGRRRSSCPCHRTRTSGLRSRRFPVPAIHSSGCLGQSAEAFRRVAAAATSVRFSDLSMRLREAQQRLADPGLHVRGLTDDEGDDAVGLKSRCPHPSREQRSARVQRPSRTNSRAQVLLASFGSFGFSPASGATRTGFNLHK
jgi:hypothetical protein